MSTYMPKANEVERKWYLLDAEGKTLGALAAEAATLLRGKHKPIFTPHVDTGDFVVVINAEKVKLSGSKEQQKIYQTYSGWRAGRRTMTAEQVREREPKRLVEQAVFGMLPGNHLCRRMMKRLRIFVGPEHTHAAQKPRAVELI